MIDRMRRLWQRVLRRDADARTREVVATLRQVPLFQHLAHGALQELAEVVHLRDYRRDEFVYYERDPGLGLYIIQRGRVRLLVEDERGTVHELRQLGPHEIFGKLSVVGDFRRMETIQVVTEARLLGFFRPDMKMLLKRHPATGTAVLEALVRTLAVEQAALIQRIAAQEGPLEALRWRDGLGAVLREDLFHPDAAR